MKIYYETGDLVLYEDNVCRVIGDQVTLGEKDGVTLEVKGVPTLVPCSTIEPINQRALKMALTCLDRCVNWVSKFSEGEDQVWEAMSAENFAEYQEIQKEFEKLTGLLAMKRVARKASVPGVNQ